MSFLSQLVIDRIKELGDKDAAEFFGVSDALVRQWAAGTKPIGLPAVEKVFSIEKLSPNPGALINPAWEGKKLALLLPFYKSTTPQTAFSLLSLIDRTKMAVMSTWGDAFIVHTRNKLAHEFLRSGIEWSLWIDDDMIVPAGNAVEFNRLSGLGFPDKYAGVHLANRLMSHGKTIVGGLYFSRNGKDNPMYKEGIDVPSERELAHQAPQDILRPATWVATGALLVHRQVYLDIKMKFPSLEGQFGEPFHFFSNSETELTRATTESLAVLQDETVSEASRIQKVAALMTGAQEVALIQSRLRQGEDVTFCKRAKASGHQAFVDLGAVCGHVGNKVFGPAPKRKVRIDLV